MFKNQSLAFKYCVYIMSCMIVVAAVIFLRNHVVIRNQILGNVAENARNLCEATAWKIEQTFAVAAAQTDRLATFMEHSRLEDEEIRNALIAYLKESDVNVFGSAIAFEPFRFDPERKFYAPYVYRDGQEVKSMFLGGDSYQYFTLDWYHIPKALQRPVWSEPYFDEGGGNVIMTTYSSPFYRVSDGRRVFQGVVTADISLSRLQRLVGSMKLYNSGYGFLLSRYGRVITHPDVSLIMNHTIFSLADELGRDDFNELGRRMRAGESGFVPFRSHLLSRECHLYFMPLKSTGWTLAVVIPEDELLAGLRVLNRDIIVMWLIGMAVLLVVIIVVTCCLARPLKKLTEATIPIGRGDFYQPLPPVDSGDEIGTLNQGFRRMQQALAEHVETLKKTTADKEKIESELKIARDIQLSIIPKFFPPFPDRNEFNLFAVLESAKAVGGDLYDFFFIDDEHLCFAIGDVSGKGVPASLFMAVTQTLLKATAARGLSAGNIVTRMNRALAKDNEMSMFVTYFLAILDIRTGELEYCNAGHNPPLVLRGEEELVKIEKLHGLPLGIMEDVVYDSARMVLAPGDGIVMYTDGVTEAMNRHHEEYGEPRLLALLKEHRDEKARGMVETIHRDVRSHAAGYEQSDDITILALLFYGA